MRNLIKNEYSLKDKIQLAWWLLRTKLQVSSARLIRYPFVVRGGGYVDYGQRLTTGVGCRIEAFRMNDSKHKRIIFGNDVQINDYVHISAIEKVDIGNNVLMASHVYISDNSHGYYDGSHCDSSPLTPPKDRAYKIAPVKIGNNVWIGEGAIIMPGVFIGDGCVIGAHSVVNHNIPPSCIAVGSPARVIKKYNYKTNHWENTQR